MASSRQDPLSDCLSSPKGFVSTKSLEDLLQCSVCCEKFHSNTRSPRQLQCHHTFCLQCLISIAGNDGRIQNFLNCPACRQEHNFGHGGVQQIPTDLKIVQLMDVLSVAEKEPDNLCHQHKQQPLDFFCKTCEELVCRDCTVVLHSQTKGHEVTKISEALKEFTPQFTNTRETAKKMLQAFQAGTQMFDKSTKQLTENEAREKSQIRKAFNGYRAQLDEREKALLSQLRGYVSRDKVQTEVLCALVNAKISTFIKLDEQLEEAKKQQNIRQIFDIMLKIMEWEKTSTDITNGIDGLHWYEYKPLKEETFRKDVLNLGKIENKPWLLQQEFVTVPEHSVVVPDIGNTGEGNPGFAGFTGSTDED